MLKSVFTIFSVLLYLSDVECNWGGIDQRVVIKGRLMCNDQPAKRIMVKLFDVDWGKDDLMAKGYTDDDGRFYLNGTENEIGMIDPQLTIFHDCNDPLPCQRKWHWRIPEHYIFRKEQEHQLKVMDIGEWNLEVKLKKEHRDCVH